MPSAAATALVAADGSVAVRVSRASPQSHKLCAYLPLFALQREYRRRRRQRWWWSTYTPLCLYFMVTDASVLYASKPSTHVLVQLLEPENLGGWNYSDTLFGTVCTAKYKHDQRARRECVGEVKNAPQERRGCQSTTSTGDSHNSQQWGRAAGTTRKHSNTTHSHTNSSAYTWTCAEHDAHNAYGTIQSALASPSSRRVLIENLMVCIVCWRIGTRNTAHATFVCVFCIGVPEMWHNVLDNGINMTIHFNLFVCSHFSWFQDMHYVLFLLIQLISIIFNNILKHHQQSNVSYSRNRHKHSLSISLRILEEVEKMYVNVCTETAWKRRQCCNRTFHKLYESYVLAVFCTFFFEQTMRCDPNGRDSTDVYLRLTNKTIHKFCRPTLNNSVATHRHAFIAHMHPRTVHS